MTLADFVASLPSTTPPALSPPLLALWRAANGDWTGAHDLVTAADDPASMWVHAYLHRKEGDLANARYWYARANKAPAPGALDDEWRAIAQALLRDGA